MLSHIARIALLAAGLVTAMQRTSRADDKFRWRVDHYDTLLNKAETSYFETEQEALNYKRTWEEVQNLSKGGPASIKWRITKELKPWKSDADTPRDLQDEDPDPAPVLIQGSADGGGGTMLDLAALGADWLGLAGDRGFTLFEYRGQNDEAYKRAKVARERVLKGVVELCSRVFADVTNTVTGFNRMLASIAVIAASNATPAADPRGAPVTDGLKLAGSEWERQEEGGLQFLSFGESGVQVIHDGSTRSRGGKWRATGPNSLEGDCGDVGSFTAKLVRRDLHVRWRYGSGEVRTYVLSRYRRAPSLGGHE